MPYLKSPSGINWFYQTKGQGKPLVFIHGWSFDSRVWFKQLDDFSEYKVVILDLPGHGNSGYKENIDIIKELNFIFDKLGLDNINLVGHSFGGLLALKFILTYPTLVNKVILIGTNAKFVKSLDYQYGLSEADVEKLRGFFKGDYPQILLVFMRWLFTPLEKATNFNRQPFYSLMGFTNQERCQSDFREIWDCISMRKTWPKKEALEEFLAIIEKEDLKNELNKINSPVLVICGTGDPICPVDSANYLGKEIGNCKVELFSNCGHLPFLTKAERFNELVHNFLK